MLHPSAPCRRPSDLCRRCSALCRRPSALYMSEVLRFMSETLRSMSEVLRFMSETLRSMSEVLRFMSETLRSMAEMLRSRKPSAQRRITPIYFGDAPPQCGSGPLLCGLASYPARPSPSSTRACSVGVNYARGWFFGGRRPREKAWTISSRDACHDMSSSVVP